MSVDKDTVRRIAKLARIALDEERVAPMEQELNGILAWVEQLQEVNVEGVEPMTSVVAQKLKMRDDVVTERRAGRGRGRERAIERRQFLRRAEGGRVMAITIAIESPLQDEVRVLVAELNEDAAGADAARVLSSPDGGADGRCGYDRVDRARQWESHWLRRA